MGMGCHWKSPTQLTLGFLTPGQEIPFHAGWPHLRISLPAPPFGKRERERAHSLDRQQRMGEASPVHLPSSAKGWVVGEQRGEQKESLP